MRGTVRDLVAEAVDVPADKEARLASVACAKLDALVLEAAPWEAGPPAWGTPDLPAVGPMDPVRAAAEDYAAKLRRAGGADAARLERLQEFLAGVEFMYGTLRLLWGEDIPAR